MATRIAPYVAADAQVFRGTAVAGEEIPHLLIADALGNVVDSIAVDPGAAARGLIVRNVPGSTVQGVRQRSQQDRQPVTIIYRAVAPAVAETLLSVQKNTNGVGAAISTTTPVTPGKILRLTSAMFGLRSGATVPAFAQFNVRLNPVGAAIATSPIILSADLGVTEAVIGAARFQNYTFGSEGHEISGAMQLAITAGAQATTNVLTAILMGYEYTP